MSMACTTVGVADPKTRRRFRHHFCETCLEHGIVVAAERVGQAGSQRVLGKRRAADGPFGADGYMLANQTSGCSGRSLVIHAGQASVPCYDLYVHLDDSGRRAVHFTIKNDTLVPTTRIDYRVRADALGGVLAQPSISATATTTTATATTATATATTATADVPTVVDAQLCAQLGEFLDAMVRQEELPVLEELVLAIDQHQGEDNVASEGFAQSPYYLT